MTDVIREKFHSNPTYIPVVMLFVIELTTYLYFGMTKIAYPATTVVGARRYYHTEYYNNIKYFTIFLGIQLLFLGIFIIVTKVGEVNCYSIYLISSMTMFAGFMVQSLYGPSSIRRYLFLLCVCSAMFLIAYIIFINDITQTMAKIVQIGVVIMIILGIVSVMQGRVNGASSWLFITNRFSINPGELSRLFLIILSVYCYKNSDRKLRRRFMFLASLSLVVCILQGDIGSTVMSAIILGISYFFIEGNVRKFMLFSGIVALGIFLISLFYKFIGSGYAIQRITATGTHLLETDGQQHSSLMAIVYGGINGLGVKKAVLATHITYSYTDFAFNIGIAVYGVIFVLIAFTPFFIIGIVSLKTRIIRAQNNLLLVISATTLFAEATIHILCNLDLIPYTGLCLPLISASGSGTLSYYILLGLLVAGLTPKIN